MSKKPDYPKRFSDIEITFLDGNSYVAVRSQDLLVSANSRPRVGHHRS